MTETEDKWDQIEPICCVNGCKRPGVKKIGITEKGTETIYVVCEEHARAVEWDPDVRMIEEGGERTAELLLSGELEKLLPSRKPKEEVPQPSPQEKKPSASKMKRKSLSELPHLDVYQWASELAQEQDTQFKEYLWTPETRRLLRRLTHTKNQLIAVVGLQGTGKTALRDALYFELQDVGEVVTVKWENAGSFLNFLRNTHLADNDVRLLLTEMVHLLYTEQGQENIRKWAEKTWGFYAPRDLDDLYAYREPQSWRKPGRDGGVPFHGKRLIQALKKKLGSSRGKKIESNSYLTGLGQKNVLLLDLPDYDKKNRRKMVQDLSDIQGIWERINELWMDIEWTGRSLNLVIFIQKELFHGHFFFGKMDVFELRPFPPKEFLEFYKKSFQNLAPFTEDALLELARLSRGVFRRFKKYILISLEKWYDKPQPRGRIQLNDVKAWISTEQLVKDMELELWDLFPRAKEKQRTAVRVLRYLQERGGSVEQTQLAKDIFDARGKQSTAGEMACSRMLDKLEAYRYVVRERSGRKKLVKIA